MQKSNITTRSYFMCITLYFCCIYDWAT